MSVDLFDYARGNTLDTEPPLVSGLRPITLDEMVGQEHIVGRDKPLYHAIQAGQLGSIISYRPSRAGKTMLAKIITSTIRANFRQINATVTDKKDIEGVVKETKDALGTYGKKAILFADKIHRFNKSRQNYLLPFVKDGTLVPTGTTMRNPHFEVDRALIPRSRIFELRALEEENIKGLLHRAVYDREKGIGSYSAKIEDDALKFLTDVSNDDTRTALNTTGLGILTTERGENGKIYVNLEVIQECIQKWVIRYDKNGDDHYDTISAFTKSTRGPDPDVAVYYLARMLYVGGSIEFIARKTMICAAEDMGIADPMALAVTMNASQTAGRIGMPEIQVILSRAVLYVVTAPKGNSAVMIVGAAMDVMRSERTMPVSVHLQDRHYKGAEKLECGIGYLYAHDYPNHYVKQQYLPDGVKGVTFYCPPDNGYEAQIREYFRKVQS